MSRTYHLLVLPIFAGFLIVMAMTLAVRLARMAATTAASTNTICAIIIGTIALIAHFGCHHLTVGIDTIPIAINAIIGSTIVRSTVIIFK